MPEPVKFKIKTLHTRGLDYHEWFLPWDPVETVRLDRLGRAHAYAWRQYLVLRCNNPKCAGVAVVPVSVVVDLADGLDPAVTR